MTNTQHDNQEKTVDPVIEKVAKEIEVILTSNGVGIQPFIMYRDSGVFPQVRLVKIPSDEPTEPAKTTEDSTVGEKSVA